MEKPKNIPPNNEGSLDVEREKLEKAISLMLDWQKAKKIKENLLPELPNLSTDEISYCLELIDNIDHSTQLRGPLADVAAEALEESEKTLVELAKKIGEKRAQELKAMTE